MEDQSNQPQDQLGDKLAKLEISLDKQGVMMYNCDWESTENGNQNVALLFYKLLFEDLSEQILDEIKQECVINNMEDDYYYIISLIGEMAEEAASKIRARKDSGHEDTDDVVVPPDQVYKI